MRILYLHQYFHFPDEPGGTRSFDLANGFIKSGKKVEIITATSEKRFNSKEKWYRLEKNGLVVHYTYLPYTNHMSYFQRSLVFLKFIWLSTFKVLSLKGDLVLASSTPLTIGIPALLKKWIHRTPFIFEVRDVWPEVVIAIGAISNTPMKKLLSFLEKLIYKNAAAIVPLSKDMKLSIVQRFPTLEIPIVIVENIAEINRFQNGIDESKSVLKNRIGYKPRFTVLYAGAFGKVNGLSYVIRMASLLKNIDLSIVFVLIGTGRMKETVSTEAENNGVLNKNVFILESIAKEELPQLYFECSMGSSFVIGIKELWANSANKFFDTMAASKPVLINHKGWQSILIHKENFGYVLPEELTKESAEDFVSYSRNVNLIKEQQQNSLRIAKQRFSLEIAISKYNNLFEQLI